MDAPPPLLEVAGIRLGLGALAAQLAQGARPGGIEEALLGAGIVGGGLGDQRSLLGRQLAAPRWTQESEER